MSNVDLDTSSKISEVWRLSLIKFSLFSFVWLLQSTELLWGEMEERIWTANVIWIAAFDFCHLSFVHFYHFEYGKLCLMRLWHKTRKEIGQASIFLVDFWLLHQSWFQEITAMSSDFLEALVSGSKIRRKCIYLFFW